MDNDKEIWSYIYNYYNTTPLDVIEKHTAIVLLEEVIERIIEFDVKDVKTVRINKEFFNFMDKYFFLIADASSEIGFEVVFKALEGVLDNMIGSRLEIEEYERAANLNAIKKVINYQRTKWIPTKQK